jgi:hypothetical protein
MKHEKSFTNRAFLLLSALFLFFLYSCSLMIPQEREKQDKIEWRSKTPAQILAELRHEQESIRDITAHFSISFDPPPEGKFSNLQGILVFARGNDGPVMRIKAMAPFGRLIFDLVQKDKLMEIFIPSRDTLYRGSFRRKDHGDNAWGSALTGMFEDFSGAEAADDAELKFSDGFVFLPLSDGILKFDEKSGYLLEVSRKGRVILYGRYEQASGQSPMPTLITMISDGGSRKIQCGLSQICLNCNPGDVFNLKDYTPRFIKGLNEIDKNSGEK